jgi:hypothetical protein
MLLLKAEKRLPREPMMSQRSKRELLEAVYPRYLKANRKGKTKIADEFVAATGYHRKYALRILKHGPSRKTDQRKGRQAIYRGEVVVVLAQIWEICGRICSRRLHPFLPEMVKVLERHGELTISDEAKALLLQISRATIDRCLQPARFEKRRGLSTTKPGGLLKQAIPVRTFADWDDAKPGFMEIDLVAHCGGSVAGQYLNTLTCTDIATCWTECLALLYRSQEQVHQGLKDMRQRLPFALLGIDSDNGTEFINELIYRYCKQEEITFTRSRPYKKNDQAHVEQKNWSIVRRTVGYDRWESEAEQQLLQSIYHTLRLYTNFFQPVLKLVKKERINGRTIRRHDTAQTPYQRVLASEDISIEIKARLASQYVQLNPVQLRQDIDKKVAKLWKISR